MKEFGRKEIILYCISDFAKGIFTGMIANYLIYFYQPSQKSGIDIFITQGIVFLGFLTVIGLVKAIGHIFDAVTDPMVALLSDRCKNKNGRRIPFMRWFAIPYALSALLIFLPPVAGVSWINNVWVAFFLWAYFLFYTFYVVPHGALLPEVIKDPKKRITAYSISSLAFVTGSALVYTTPVIVSLFKSGGFSATAAWKLTFVILSAIGLALLLISAFSINEKDYAVSTISKQKGFKVIGQAFKNKHFCVLTLGQLFSTISMAFFQATMMFYITDLLGLAEAQSTLIMIISIVLSLVMYPFIVVLSKKYGKKMLMILASVVFTVAYIVIFFADLIPIVPIVKGVLFAVFVSFPFAVLNILPGAMMSDVIQYDTIRTKENNEGVYSAARSFITKMGQSIAIMVVPSVLSIGAIGGGAGILGIKMTAIIAAAVSVLSILFFCFYNNKHIMKYISDKKDGEVTEELNITEAMEE